jgi:AraC-like DNA-binding protein
VRWAPGYREWLPPQELRGSLTCLWVAVVPPGEPLVSDVLPDACTDLIWQSGHGAYVAGPDTGPAPTPVPPGTVLVGARFGPGAGGPAFGIPLAELRDQRVDLAGCLPALAGHLPGDLPPEAALEAVTRLSAQLARAGPPDLAVVHGARLLAGHRSAAGYRSAAGHQSAAGHELAAGHDPVAGHEPVAYPESVAGLSDILGLSERQLRRRFDTAVGYGPKTLHRVLRFRRVLAQLSQTGPATDLADLAVRAGYADQAHLTRETTRLAGRPPAALAKTFGTT